MTRIQAARAAAEIRNELGEEVELENGSYGELKVFVDGKEVVSAGALAFLGILPSIDKIRDAVAAELPDTKDPP